MTPNTYCYFDYYQTADTKDEPLGIGGYVPIEKVYSLDPTFDLNEEQKKLVLELFSAISTTVVLHESHIPEFSAFIGSGPAFIFHLLESFVEVGLRLGFSYHDAKQLAEKLMAGSVRLAQENPEVPHAKLRMNVCSPGGSSIEMDRLGVRGAIIETVLATHRRALEMSTD